MEFFLYEQLKKFSKINFTTIFNSQDQKSSFVDAVFEGNLRGAGKAVTFTTDNAHRYRSDSGADMVIPIVVLGSKKRLSFVLSSS